MVTKSMSEDSQRFFDLMELASGKRPASGYSVLKDRIFSLNKRASQKKISRCHGGHCPGGLGVKNVVKNVEEKFYQNDKLETKSEDETKAKQPLITNGEISSTRRLSSEKKIDSLKYDVSSSLKGENFINPIEDRSSTDNECHKLQTIKFPKLQNNEASKSEVPKLKQSQNNKCKILQTCKDEKSKAEVYRRDLGESNIANSYFIKELMSNVKKDIRNNTLDDRNRNNIPEIETKQKKNMVRDEVDTKAEIIKPFDPFTAIAGCPCLDEEVHYYYSYTKRKRKICGVDVPEEIEDDLPPSKAKLRIREGGDEFEEVEMDQLHEYLSLDYSDFFNNQNEVEEEPTVVPDPDLIAKNHALLEAIKEDDLLTVEEMLDTGADPNFVHEEDGTSVLHSASLSASLQIVQALTAAGANHEVADSRGRTPLHEAASAGREEVVMHFALSEVDLNTPDNIGIRPLELALVQGRVSTIQVLLKFNADTKVKNPMGESAEMVAQQLGYPPLELIRNRRNHCTSCASCAKKQAESLPSPVRLVRAIQQDNSEYIQHNLKYEDSPNLGLPLALYYPGKGTLLHYATFLGSTNALKELIIAGANLKAKDSEGKTPIQVAIKSGHEECSKLLEIAASL